MDGAGVPDEVRARQGISGEELVRQHIALEPVAGSAGDDEVAGDVLAAAGQRVNVVEGGVQRIQVMPAVDAAPAAVAEGRPLEGAPYVAREPLAPEGGTGVAAVTPG